MEGYATLIASTPGAATYLKTNAGSTVSQITTMWSSYDYVYGHFAEVRSIEGADFLARSPAYPLTNPVITFAGQQNSNTLIIVAIVSASVATLLLVGGYFYLRKRKEDK